MPYDGFRTLLISFCIAAGCASGNAVRAAVIPINSLDCGWYEDDGHHDPTNQNYAVGKTATTGGPYTVRDWFIFNVPNVATITSARLRLYNPLTPDTGYESADATETYTVFDVTTTVPTLQAGSIAGGAVGLATYDDLGTGASYGSTTVSHSDDGQFVLIDFNAAGLVALNARRGNQLAVGGAITTLEVSANRTEHLFGWTVGTAVAGNTTLELFPEPSMTAVIAIAAIAGVMKRRRYSTVSKRPERTG